MAQPSKALASNHKAMAQRVERDLKGHLILQMEGSCPVRPTPMRITGSHLKCQLASDSMVLWPQKHSLCCKDTAVGVGPAFRKPRVQNLPQESSFLSVYLQGK